MRIGRVDAEELDVHVLDRHQSSRPHHSAQLPHGCVQILWGKELDDVRAPHGIEAGVEVGQGQYRRGDRGLESTGGSQPCVFGCEVAAMEIPIWHHVAQDRKKAAGATTDVQHPVTRAETGPLDHLRVLSPAGFQVQVQPGTVAE